MNKILLTRAEIDEGLEAVLKHPLISREKKDAFRALCNTAQAYWALLDLTTQDD